MSLEGLRAWIGEVERKLGKRTRVFLALTVIAIGIAAAALYLAIDARNSSVSESDVQALQQKLETRIESRGGSAATAASGRSRTGRRRRSPKNRSAAEGRQGVKQNKELLRRGSSR